MDVCDLTFIQSLSRYVVCSSCSMYSDCPFFCQCISSTFVVNKQHILNFFDIFLTYCRCKAVVCRCFITVFLFELYVDDSIKVTRKNSQTNLTKTRNRYAKIDYERPSKPTSRQTVQFAPLHIAEYCRLISYGVGRDSGPSVLLHFA